MGYLDGIVATKNMIKQPHGCNRGFNRILYIWHVGENGKYKPQLWYLGVSGHVYIFLFFLTVFTPSRHDHFDREHDDQLIQQMIFLGILFSEKPRSDHDWQRLMWGMKPNIISYYPSKAMIPYHAYGTIFGGWRSHQLLWCQQKVPGFWPIAMYDHSKKPRW